jgi:DNA-binding response OmpR family regulator
MKGKITVIEDDADLRGLLQTALHLEGFEVQSFSNGDDFLISMKSNPRSDLYVIDINLGGTRGFEICSRIKENTDTSKSLVILISANPEVQQHARESLADDYMLKPFTQRELVQKITKLLK